MLKIEKIVISTRDRKHQQAIKDVEITPQNGDVFIFSNPSEMQDFVDELRQTFEIVFPFWCSVMPFIQNN